MPPENAPRVRFRWSRYHAMTIAVPADKAMRDRIISGIGALVGIIATGLLVGSLTGVGAHMPLLIAPIGAAAVLLFAVPASPMAQPWPVIAGNVVSAIVGAYLALFPRARLGLVIPLGLFLEFVRIPAPLLIGFWILLQVLFTFVGPAFGAVVWWTHIAGFLIGIIFALISRPAIARRLRQ